MNRPAAALERMTLQRRLIVFAVIPLAILDLLIGLVGTYEARQLAAHLVLERNTALVEAAGAGLSAELNVYLAPLQSAAGLLGAPGSDRQAVLASAAPYLARFDGGVALLDASGRAVGATPDHPERVGLDYSFRPYFQQAQAGARPVFSAVLAEEPSGRPAVVIAVPAPDGEQTQPAVLAGVLFLDRPWTAELSPVTAGGRREAYLVDAHGGIIYHPNATTDAALDALFAGQRAAAPVLEMIAAGRPASVLPAAPVFGRSERMLVSYAPLPGVGWGLVLEEPWDAILAAANPWQWVLLALLFSAAVLGPILLLLSLQRVTRPLAALAREAGQVAAGMAFRPLPVQGPAEVRTLIAVFNRMVRGQERQRATVREYAVRVLQSQEEERKRLARELHDETVQQMVGLVQRIDLCRSDLARDPAAARRRLDELQALARQAAGDLRRMSNDLRPLLLEDAGLTLAVQTLSDGLGRALPGARVHCEIVGTPRRLDSEVELVVFRIVQEALSNVRKHASAAEHVNTTLYYEDWGLLATVEDDGPGFEADDVEDLMRQGHLGLAGMYERARLFGADLEIESVAGAGTTVTLRVQAESSQGGGDE